MKHHLQVQEQSVSDGHGEKAAAPYLFPNDWHDSHDRLTRLEKIEDSHTMRHLAALGVGMGWRCLEVGAGAGSITRWLCGQAGPSGRVVAMDIDTRFLDGLSFPQLQVRAEDLRHASLEEDAFDLVHARHVLIHVPKRDLRACLEKLTASMAEEGVILIEESDLHAQRADPLVDHHKQAIYDETVRQIQCLYARRGMDLRLGSALPELLSACGIANVQFDSRARVVAGGCEEARFHKMTYTQLREAAVGGWHVPAEKFDAFLALHDDPSFAYRTRVTVAAWGWKRRPGGTA